MKLGVFANTYDSPYYWDFKAALSKQHDHEFTTVQAPIESIQNVLAGICLMYDAVLLLDIDDVPLPPLVSTAKKYLEEYDVVAFSMQMFGEIEGIFGAHTGHVFGFGNTAWRSDCLRRLLPYTTDYEMAQKARESGARMVLVPDPMIKYRQYGQNDNLIEIDGRWAWRTS